MKSWRWFDSEGAFIFAGLVVSMILVSFFPLSSHIQSSRSIIPVEQGNVDILRSGTYQEDKHIITTSEKKYTVWLNRGTLPLKFGSRISLEQLLKCRKDQLMYIPTSPIWKAPIGRFPGAITVRVKNNNNAETYYRTFFEKNSTFHLPVFSLIVNEHDFFDAETGISVQGINQGRMPLRTRWWDMPGNYTPKGKEHETVAYFDYFDRKGTCAYSAFAGMRIHGNATRAFPQKSFRVTALGKAGEKKKFDFDFFNDNRPGAHALILRNGGNDWGRTLIADALMQKLVIDLDIDAQACQPVTVYINGEYWGIYSLREKIDEYFLSARYKCKKKQVTLIEMDEVKNGKKKVYKGLTELIDRLTNEERDDKKVFHEISEQVDISNFMNYLFAELYFGNTDWPHNNCKYYKAGQKKWRWIVYDLDYGYGYIGNPKAYQIDLFATLLKSNIYTARLFRLLIRTGDFKKLFLQRCEEVMRQQLNETEQLRQINNMERWIRPELPNHIRRWRKPLSVDQWEQYLYQMKVFVQHRNKIFKDQLLKYCH